jgi:hypothetical protein
MNMNNTTNALPSLFRRLIGVMAVLAIHAAPANGDMGFFGRGERIRVDPPLARLAGPGAATASEFCLLAVPRGQQAPHPTSEMPQLPDGVLRSAPLTGDGSQTLLRWQEFEGYRILYRVHITGDRLEVTWLESEAPKTRTWNWPVGVGLTVIGVVAGLAWMRHSRRARRRL